jgi:glycosyltransferase involved in cell wall biosynthesis
MVTRELPPDSGGIGYYVYNLSRKLRERGHKVVIITRGSKGRSTHELVQGIEVYRVSFFPVYPFHIWVHGLFINSLIKSFGSKFDIIHMHSPLVPPVKTSLPIMTTVHTPSKIDAKYHEIIDFPSLAERMQSAILYPLYESRLFSKSMSVTAVSFSVANELRTYGLDFSKIAVVRNGVDEKTFIPVNKQESEKKYVLYTGVLRARKGLFDLIDCAEQVCRVNPTVNFLICGTGPFFSKIEQEIQKRGLRGRVILLGRVNRGRLIQLYQNATIHVVPSHYEGLPTVLLEAMSCGLPVVATNVGGASDVISSGKNGFLVPPKSPQLLAKVILKLLDDDKLRMEIGEAARKTIERSYTWDKIADKIQKCYEDVLQEHLIQNHQLV